MDRARGVGALLRGLAFVLGLMVVAGVGFGYLFDALALPWAEAIGFAVGVIVVVFAASMVYVRRYVAPR